MCPVHNFAVAALRYLPYGSCLYSRRGQASHAHHDYILTDAQARTHACMRMHFVIASVLLSLLQRQACRPAAAAVSYKTIHSGLARQSSAVSILEPS